MLHAAVPLRRVRARADGDVQRAWSRHAPSLVTTSLPGAHGPIGRRRAQLAQQRQSLRRDPLLAAAHLPVARARLHGLAGDRRVAPALVLALLVLATGLAAMPPAPVTGNEVAVDAQPIARLGALLATNRSASVRDATAASRHRGEASATGAGIAGPLVQNGALLRPVGPAPTALGVAASDVRLYTVQEGDTLTAVARRFGLSVMTVWWANRMEPEDRLEVGQQLVIPFKDGVLHVVAEGESLASIAQRYMADLDDIVRYNGLSGGLVSVGQQLLVPDGRPAAVFTASPEPTPTPTPTPTPEPTPVVTPKPKPPAPTQRASSGGSAATCKDCRFSGAMVWPVPGGKLSQGYSGGHQAIDIHAPYGTRVVAAGGGKVIFSGWKDNGGGWQVWISHGSDTITTYNHMSSLSVRTGASVGAGQAVGRIGATGWATGPHLHFDVWIGYPWRGGYRVNPLGYL